MYEFFRKIVCLSMHIKYRIKVIGGDNRPYKNGIKGGYIIACNFLVRCRIDPPRTR